MMWHYILLIRLFILSGEVNCLFYTVFLTGNIALLLSYAIRAVKIAIAGEDILVELEATKEALQQVKITQLEPNGTPMLDLENRRLDVLIERFSTHRGIRPRNYFSIGKSNSFSSFGLVLTYYIVLLQFRFSEN